jgi:hypothetical protein
MRPWLSAVAGLLCLTVGVAHANYIKITVNLGVTRDNTPGYGQIGGMLGMIGGVPGDPDSIGGGALGPLGPMGPGGFRGVQGGFGATGGIPGDPDQVRGGFRGVQGGFGAVGGVPGPGGVPGGFGAVGAPGGIPGMPGGLGIPGGEYGGEYGYGYGYGEFIPESTPRYVEAVVEIRKLFERIDPADPQRRKVYTIEHKWGKTTLYESEAIKVNLVRLPPVIARYQRKRSDLGLDKRGVDKVPKLLELADWALSRGLVKQFTEIMDELAKEDAKHPVVVAYRKVQADMDRKDLKDEGVAAWAQRLPGFNIRQSAHYTLFYDSPKKEPAEVRSRLDRLEDNYRKFFYWFALRGKALPVPSTRLLAVLVDGEETFERQHAIFDKMPLVADGFYARRDNIAVFSAVRLDEPFDALTHMTDPLWQTYDADTLLKGEGWRKDKQWQETARAQTLTLLTKALEEESEIATVSHEGTRQLVAATGLLPRGVQAPEWIQFGMASFFETPKGAYWPGTGAPSWTYLTNHLIAKNAKKLDRPVDALKAVITDKDFRNPPLKDQQSPLAPAPTDRGAAQPGQPVPAAPGQPGLPAAREEKKEKEPSFTKARTMAWALTYYLAHKRLNGLLRYYQELAALPRDLEFDEDVLLNVFARAFDLLDGNQINENKLASFATDWRRFIDQTPLEVMDVLKEANKIQTDSKPGSGTRPGGS